MSSEWANGLHVVAGAVFEDVRVMPDDGQPGGSAVAEPDAHAVVSVDYRIPRLRPMSLALQVTYRKRNSTHG